MDKKLKININSTVSLNNDVEMPVLGLGVYQISNGFDINKAVIAALEEGYRLIDTAAMYNNERGVSEAIGISKYSREKVFVTSKLWNEDHGYDNARKAFDHTMRLLGFKYLDLYLIHWPASGKLKETWRALEDIYREGRVRAIGVSNFQEHHLEEIMSDAEVIPAVNQIEFHPKLVQQSLLDYCKDHKIQVQSWSPLMQGGVVDIPELEKIGKGYGKSAAQVVLRWNLQKGVITIPKSAKPQRIRENANIFDFTLTDEEMEVIDSLDEGSRLGPDPDNF